MTTHRPATLLLLRTCTISQALPSCTQGNRIIYPGRIEVADRGSKQEKGLESGGWVDMPRGMNETAGLDCLQEGGVQPGSVIIKLYPS